MSVRWTGRRTFPQWAGTVAHDRQAQLSPTETPLHISAMASTRQDLLARLDELGIETTTVDHPAVFTVAESSVLEQQLPGGHTKNLFLKDKRDRLFLVVALAHAHIDLKSLHKTLGCDRLSFGRAELLMEVLGVPPGSVTPFAVLNDPACRVTVVLDAGMIRHERLNFHPLENTATTNIAREDLLSFIRSCGHDPRIVGVATA